MQVYIKQRWVGAGIAMLIGAIVVWLIWHHPAVPPLLVQSPSHTVVSAPGREVVCDLPLVTTVHSTPSPPATEDFFATTSAELRAKAAHTSQVTAHILRTQSPAVVELEVDESVQKKHILHLVPTAWVIQLATFRDAEQARAMVKTLRRMGLLAYVRSDVHVFVGPYIDRRKSDRLQNMLEQKMHIEGTVKKFIL